MKHFIKLKYENLYSCKNPKSKELEKLLDEKLIISIIDDSSNSLNNVNIDFCEDDNKTYMEFYYLITQFKSKYLDLYFNVFNEKNNLSEFANKSIQQLEQEKKKVKTISFNIYSENLDSILYYGIISNYHLNISKLEKIGEFRLDCSLCKIGYLYGKNKF